MDKANHCVSALILNFVSLSKQIGLFAFPEWIEASLNAPLGT